MRKLLLILVLAVMCSSIARAGEMDAGAAYDKGNYAKALVLMNELAAKGSPFGQFFLGQMYRKGAGVTPDYKEAVQWYRMAADQGYVLAQYNLGAMYATGKGVMQDYKKANRWNRMAAEQGHASSQSKLGEAYLLGVLEIDPVRAHMWCNLAAFNGEKRGTGCREIAAKKLTFSQIYKAQKMAQDCVKKKYKNCD